MDSDPRNLDGSDSPSSIQAQPPPGYTKFKESLKGALLLLAGLDQASAAMLKHDEEYRKAVQSLLVPLSSTPISEIIEQAIKSGLDAAVSHISTHIPRPRTTHPTPQVAPSAQRSSTTVQSPFQAPLSGGESLPSPHASSGPGAFGPLSAQYFIPFIPGESQPRSTTVVAGMVRATSWQDRLQAAMRQRDPLANDSQDGMVSVYLIHLVRGKWIALNPAEGLVYRLNSKMNAARNRRKMVSSRRGLPLVDRFATSLSFESQDWVAEAFMGQGGRIIVLVGPRQTSSAGEHALLCDLQQAVAVVQYSDLTAGGCEMTTQLAVSSIEWDLVRSVF